MKLSCLHLHLLRKSFCDTKFVSSLKCFWEPASRQKCSRIITRARPYWKSRSATLFLKAPLCGANKLGGEGVMLVIGYTKLARPAVIECDLTGEFRRLSRHLNTCRAAPRESVLRFLFLTSDWGSVNPVSDWTRIKGNPGWEVWIALQSYLGVVWYLRLQH